jgi:F0F1-type ATP synthase assembly protein I
MEIFAFVLLGIAFIINLVYGIAMIIKAFQVSVWWGLGYLFVPFGSLIFIIAHWQVAKDPFLKSLLAIPFMIAAVLLLPEETLNQLIAGTYYGTEHF